MSKNRLYLCQRQYIQNSNSLCFILGFISQIIPLSFVVVDKQMIFRTEAKISERSQHCRGIQGIRMTQRKKS